MKKIIYSFAIIAAAAAVIIGGTQAFFSDTETSNNNTFAAGSLDLRFQVDGEPGVFADVNGAPLFDVETFPLYDLKPGDQGERTVRLWVDDNPACGQLSINVTSDLDNDCTEPEGKDEGGTTSGCTPEGELNDEVNFIVWADDCDNILENEKVLVSGSLTNSENYYIGELPTTEETAQCYGIAYCFGEWNGTSCDGSSVNNVPQTDSFKADLIINALQKRTQFPNGCPTGEVEEIITVTSSTMNFSSTGWAGWSCPTTHPNIVSGTTNCAQPLSNSLAWQTGASVGAFTYPTTPFGYTYGANEEGWIVQNGGTGQSCNIILSCQAN